jgi:hypothetical protein
VHAWAAVNDQAADEKKMVHWYAMITPIIPVVLFFFFKWDVIPAMLIAMFYALLSTGYFKNLKNMEETIYRCTKESISDSALLIAFLLTAAMFATVARTSAPFFQSVLGNVIPSNPLVLVIGLAVFAPLALYRGPLTAYGCGLAIVAIVIGSGYFDNQYVYMLFANTSMAITLMACPTQSWTQWTLNYANSSSTDHVKTALPWVWVMAAVNMFIAYIMFA